MPYIALRFVADAAEAGQWVDALIEAGALSVDVSDALADSADETPIYAEHGEAIPAFWGANCLTALFPGNADPSAALAAAGRSLQRRVPPHECNLVADKDWVRATQAQFAPMRIGDRLWIVPSWCEPVDPHAINLRLDPGLAFGTGSHATTRLCLAWLAQHLRPGAEVLDYGCGSGILAIAAAKLGARKVVGVDIDAQAIAASRDNAARNGVEAQFLPADEMGRADVQAFDVVVANILANPLIVLAPALAARTKVGAEILLSGILEPQADGVIDAYAGWFNIAAVATEDGWTALAGVRRM